MSKEKYVTQTIKVGRYDSNDQSTDIIDITIKREKYTIPIKEGGCSGYND